MTAPEPTAVERTIAEVDKAHRFGEWREVSPGRHQRACTCGYLLDCTDEDHLYADMHRHRAQTVVAAIRNLPPEQMAELIGGEVQGGYHWGARFYPSGADDEIDAVRVVTPWREVTGPATPARDLTPGGRDV